MTVTQFIVTVTDDDTTNKTLKPLINDAMTVTLSSVSDDSTDKTLKPNRKTK